MRIGIIGLGHVGLPTAAALASIGHDVAATDVDGEKIALLSDGRVPFYEPGLDELVTEGTAAGRLRFSQDPADVVPGAEVVFICVGTPPTAGGEASLAAMESAGETIARHATGSVVVVEKSTVPAGTAERLRAAIRRYRRDLEVLIVSNPEFLREGRAVEDSLRPDRILVGADAPEALATMRRVYEPLLELGARWIETDLRTAELAKHASNAFLALKISYANALARICELAGADVIDIAEVMGADPRIGPDFLRAGLGYGGFCFPKDLVAFERLADRLGYRFPLLAEIARINDEAIDAAFQKVESVLWNLEGKRVTLLGLAFKPGTDDIRFAPALTLARKLLDGGANVVGTDPQAGVPAKAEVPDLEVVEDPYDALSGAHCAVVCTEWPEYRALDLARVRRTMAFPVMVDARNVFEPMDMAAAGFTHLPTGRRPIEQAGT